MARPSFSDVEKLISQLILPFYRIERDISTPPPARKLENDAEHSWSLALLACALAPHVDTKLDVGKVCQFAIVHDLAEVYAGDTSAVATAEVQQTKHEREQRAVDKIAQEFTAFPWIIQTLKMYERQKAAEARFVRSVDKVLPIYFLYLDEFLHDRHKQFTMEGFIKVMESHRAKAMIHDGAFVYYQEVWEALLAHPEYFHQPQKD